MYRQFFCFTLSLGEIFQKTKLRVAMTNFRTHYDNLKVNRDASSAQIRWAYKRLCQKFHPDKNRHDSDAARKFQLINRAFGVLSNPESRKKHNVWIEEQSVKVQIKTSSSTGDRGSPLAILTPKQTKLGVPRSLSSQSNLALKIKSTRTQYKEVSRCDRSRGQKIPSPNLLKRISAHTNVNRKTWAVFFRWILCVQLLFFTSLNFDQLPEDQTGYLRNSSIDYSISENEGANDATQILKSGVQAEQLGQRRAERWDYLPEEHSEEWVRENIF